MSGSRKPPPSALIRRASPDLTDADLAALLHWHGHLFGRKKLHAVFEPEAEDARMRILNEEDADLAGSYVIYDEALQRFIGIVRRGAFMMARPTGAGRARMTLYPAAQA